ncbi:MAG TPA: phosphoribosylformylglycinamidine cyclo-ligase [Candidatus Magasanikbacteria bacterium]|nr:phosphoribosylformylglycinamidine cyclo-ligase [Candidatus Magasanikbacteria bacterium]
MPITYSQVGDNYDLKDPIKKLAQVSAAATGKNLLQHNFTELTDSRGESAYVWEQGGVYMATTIEGLGTKNLVADNMQKITGKTYYEIIGHETVATIINDLITVGAKPLTCHAYWAVGSNDWFQNTERLKDLIGGWKNGCDTAGVSWGGGESPTLTKIVDENCIDLGGSAVGIIEDKNNLISDTKLQDGDRIILLKSTGINANGLSLARAVAEKLPEKYATKLPSGVYYGEAVLNKTNIYAKLLQNIFSAGVNIHYVSNITGHGLRKIMRARGNFTYNIEKIFEPQEVFSIIQQYAELSDYQIYETYNMGQDYAIFVSQADVDKTLEAIKQTGFVGLDAGYVKAGERQVIIEPKNIIFKGESLDLR